MAHSNQRNFLEHSEEPYNKYRYLHLMPNLQLTSAARTGTALGPHFAQVCTRASSSSSSSSELHTDTRASSSSSSSSSSYCRQSLLWDAALVSPPDLLAETLYLHLSIPTTLSCINSTKL